ncbi:phosphoribosylaminoimidazolesuccinocarboxamide synthase [bacterium]|nr:phosphoribosylaminoimidazolesuccinocarboxamide synthase [bacterium]
MKKLGIETLIYEGKAKKLFSTKDENILIQEFKDDATAFNGQKKGQILNKGVINNQISTRLYQYLESHFISTHFLKKVSYNAMEIRKLKMFKLEVIVRNIAAGSICKRENIAEGTVFPSPLLEFCYKDDSLGDPFITTEEILEKKLANAKEIEIIRKMTLKINALLKDFFLRRNLKLVDFKLEFGIGKDKSIRLGDEISPDTCRFWDATTNEKLDKDRFRQDLGGVENAYEEILSRIS